MQSPISPRSKHTRNLSQLTSELNTFDNLLRSDKLYTTDEIYTEVKSVYPDLCDDNYTVKKRYGKWAESDNRPAWKYVVRWAIKNNKDSGGNVKIAGTLTDVGRGTWFVN